MTERADVPAAEDADRTLVDRVLDGDHDAYRLVVDRYQARVIRLVYALAGNQAAAEDVAQETFLRAFRSLSSFRGTSLFRTWLFRIAVNVARSARQSHQRRREDGIGGAAELDIHAGPASLEHQIVARDRVRRALAMLPPDLREAVVLRDVEGLDYREIASALGVPIGTVESRIFRGRARLRAALHDTPADGALP